MNWNLINRDNIDRIEISKGPGNAKYGSNAMGGVINIITRNPVKKYRERLPWITGRSGTFGCFSVIRLP